MKTIAIKVSDEFHKILKLHLVNKSKELKNTIIELLKEEIEADFEGKTWGEVKSIFENYTNVDGANVDPTTGECTVDFTNEFNEYSVAGRMIKTEEETILEIDDEAVLYKNV